MLLYHWCNWQMLGEILQFAHPQVSNGLLNLQLFNENPLTMGELYIPDSLNPVCLLYPLALNQESTEADIQQMALLLVMFCLKIRCPNPEEKLYCTFKVPVHLMKKNWTLRWKVATTTEPWDSQVSHYETEKRILFKPLLFPWADACVSGALMHASVKQDHSPMHSCLCGVPRSEAA